MNKYIQIAKISFKEQMAYNFNNIFRIMLPLARIVLAVILWSVLFEGKYEISGFTLKMMITYYIMINFLKGLDASDQAVLSLSSEIREGKFTKYLVKPVRPLLYFISSCCSKSFYFLIINIVTTAIYIMIFNRYFVIAIDLATGIGIFVLTAAGMNFLILLNYLIAIFSFKFMEVMTFNILKGAIMEFLTGMLIPIALLPEFVIKGMSYFPFYHVFYYPSLVISGKENLDFLFSFSVLLAWNIAVYLIISVSYRRLIRIYDGAGI